MRLKDFYPDLEYDKEIKQIAIHSKSNLKNSIFVCKKGTNFDSHDVIDEIKDEASFIVSEKPLDENICHIVVSDSSLELARLLAIFHKDALNGLKIIGTTGTDGKTTTAMITYQVLENLNSAYLGTNGLYYQDKIIELANTTPGITVLYDYLLTLKEKQINFLSMEVSSHGIRQNRIKNIAFAYKVFTNLTHEHLDEFIDMEQYFNAKKNFFLEGNFLAIINIDDPYGFRLYSELKTPKISFGRNIKADFQIIDIKTNAKFSVFYYHYKDNRINKLKLSLPCDYNVYNAIPSVIIGLEEHLSLKHIQEKLSIIKTIPGRFEKFSVGDFSVVIDFAHTPNALENLLRNIKALNFNKIYLVLGASGNRDTSKRKIMGKIASEVCDFVYFTEEDSYTEDVVKIIDMLVSDISTKNYEIIISRQKAILKALAQAKTNDCVVICGKGLENTMKTNNKIIEYSDLKVLESYVKTFKPKLIH